MLRALGLQKISSFHSFLGADVVIQLLISLYLFRNAENHWIKDKTLDVLRRGNKNIYDLNSSSSAQKKRKRIERNTPSFWQPLDNFSKNSPFYKAARSNSVLIEVFIRQAS